VTYLIGIAQVASLIAVFELALIVVATTRASGSITISLGIQTRF